MSLKTLLMPAISQRLLSRERLLKKRMQAEKTRQTKHLRHTVYYFHQVDDPYSALAAQALPQLLARYDIQLIPNLVPPPIESAAPERDKLIAYSRRDAHWLAQRHGLVFQDRGRQPEPAAVQRASAWLAGNLSQDAFVTLVIPLSAGLWSGLATFDGFANAGALAQPGEPQAVAKALASGQALRKRLGHYLGATFYYAGEWYWGLDRLYHLEQRLQATGAARSGTTGVQFSPAVDLTAPVNLAQPASMDFFFSLRSPYSAIVTPRVFALAGHTGVQVHLKYLLPMAMRGLPVPREKRNYISQDAAREAFVQGTPFGRVNDPLGRPTERGIALIPLAERQGCAHAYLRSFMQGVWAEGIDAGSERGLRTIATRAGLDWPAAQQALQDEGWRAIAERNREEMFSLGLWGVPTFRVNHVAVWGQDRLAAVQEELLKGRR